MTQPFTSNDPEYVLPLAAGMAMGDSEANPNYPADSTETVRRLNDFLRGEIAAAETYRLAIERLSQSQSVASETGLLRKIQEEHGRAIAELRERIRELNGEPSDSSGAWGAWAKMTQSLSNMFGEAGALRCLREGEEHGLKDYEEGLDGLDAESVELIQNQLIPGQQRHIDVLKQLIRMRASA